MPISALMGREVGNKAIRMMQKSRRRSQILKLRLLHSILRSIFIETQQLSVKIAYVQSCPKGTCIGSVLQSTTLVSLLPDWGFFFIQITTTIFEKRNTTF